MAGSRCWSMPEGPVPLTLHYHPLASFCWKVLIALYENGTPFAPHLVDLGDPASREAFLRLCPMGKLPVLQDRWRWVTVPESTVIVGYLTRPYPAPARPPPA